MNFRKVLIELNRIERKLGEGVTAEEFARHCSVNMPTQNARVYLLRLYKMNFARRRKDRSVGATNHPYRYNVSKTGRKYLEYLHNEHFYREEEIVETMMDLIDDEDFDQAIELYEDSKGLFFHKEMKMIAQGLYIFALEDALEELRRKKGR